MEIDPYLINPKKKIELNGKYKLSWTEDSLHAGGRDDNTFTASGNSHLGSSFSDTKKTFWFLFPKLLLSFLYIFQPLLLWYLLF